MHYRELGKTGVRVSEVGMGCNRLGEDPYPDEHWVNLVQRAVDLGVTLFDSSEAYKRGRSEEMLGRAIGNRDDILIATKMSRVPETDEKDYSAARMMRTVEDSLRRLQRDWIDIYQLHSPNREDMERFDWSEGMERLKRQGKIRFTGVAVNSAEDGLWLIRQSLVEVLQITYNIFVTEAEDELLSAAQDRGVGLLCRMPLARGVLTGKFRPGQEVPSHHRATLDGPRMDQHIEMAEGLRPIAEAYEGGMTRMAHHFCLTQQAISAIIPGARTVEQLTENVAASNGEGLPPDVEQKIRQVQREWNSS
jgi:aryl-alcohol dehydrogenase-like predicted oxidoreductase